MNKIKILPPQEAQKIAAGEVIERPANIVKEIIENSIDANSTKISLYIEDYGKKLIRVVDDGDGMSSNDAKLCFIPHATSKIKMLDDLENISSFGFRGEALASIAAVSKISIKTKPKINDKKLGTKIDYENGIIKNIETAAIQYGTDIQIKDLFYNTPVRKKFLKQDETEFNLIQNIFHAFCLSNLKINFKLFNNNKLILNAPASETIRNRASQLWGHEFSEKLVELPEGLTNQYQSGFKFEISGAITNHNFSRYGRQQIFFFVNNRYIRSTELNKALFKGYMNILPPAKFPACFVFIRLENQFVDINVHPKKEEVRFLKPKVVENRLKNLVQEALQNNLNRSISEIQKQTQNTNFLYSNHNNNINALGLCVEEKSIAKTISSDQKSVNYFFINNNKIQNKQRDIELNSKDEIRLNSIISSSNEPYTTVKKKHTKMDNLKEKNLNLSEINNISKAIQNKIIGQLFQTYILIEGKDEFVIIDQHAAHERILYEEFLKNFEKKDGTKLMFPEIITLKENQLNHILQSKVFLSNQGIEIELFGKHQIAIKTSPPKIQNHDLKQYILDIADFIDENEKLDPVVFRKKLNEHMHSHLACKMAIKAGDILTQKEMTKLIDDLQKTKNRLICVHGRPTSWIVSKYQLERTFRRK